MHSGHCPSNVPSVQLNSIASPTKPSEQLARHRVPCTAPAQVVESETGSSGKAHGFRASTSTNRLNRPPLSPRGTTRQAPLHGPISADELRLHPRKAITTACLGRRSFREVGAAGRATLAIAEPLAVALHLIAGHSTEAPRRSQRHLQGLAAQGFAGRRETQEGTEGETKVDGRGLRKAPHWPHAAQELGQSRSDSSSAQSSA